MPKEFKNTAYSSFVGYVRETAPNQSEIFLRRSVADDSSLQSLKAELSRAGMPLAPAAKSSRTDRLYDVMQTPAPAADVIKVLGGLSKHYNLGTWDELAPGPAL